MNCRRGCQLRWSLVLAGCLALASCRTISFYTHAARGQWEISSKAKPIAGLLCSPATSARVRGKLELVQELRRFATQKLSLPAEKQYDCYCDLGRKYVVWVVYAAPEFSVEGKTWWYPLVGSLKYRGFFDRLHAEREARLLQKQGYDVYFSGVEAYSTLGWLHDPVLNTFLNRTDANLAELLFHELTHQRLYVSGDTDFNEAFATAVGQEGARRWLRSKGRTKELKIYETENRLQREFVTMLLETRERLKTIYEQNKGAPAAKLRELKAAELARLRQYADDLNVQLGGKRAVDRWFAKPLNNARLNTLATYFGMLPGFEAMLKSEDGDIVKFFHRVESMKPMTKQERKMLLMNIAAGSL